jgi:NDP-sugar pyrophosphorylase family protein
VDDGLGGFYAGGKFIDIGTPESFNLATKYFKGKK